MRLGTLTNTEVAERISRLDASGRSLYQLCPAKFQKRYVLGLTSASDEGPGAWPRHYGTAIHAGMEHDDLDAAKAAFHAVYDEAGKGPSAELVEEVRAAPYANNEKAHVHAPDRGDLMLEGYWKKYRAHDTFVTFEREQRLTMPFGEGRTYYGRIDRIMAWANAPDAKLHGDYRTTAGKGASGMVTDPFPQQEGYITLSVANGHIEPAETHEFIMDVLTKDTTLDGRNYRKGDAFERCHEARTQAQLNYWRLETAAIWDDIDRDAERDFWPMAANSACFAFRTPCEFLAICHKRGDPEAQAVLCDPAQNDLYVEKPWEPLEGFEI